MDGLIIHIGWEYGLGIILSIITLAYYAGGRLAGIQTSLMDVKTKMDSIYERFIKVEERVDTLWKDKFAPASSPRHLNQLGQNILRDSGIQEIVELKKEKLLEEVKKLDPKNAYDAEHAIEKVVSELPKHCPEVIDQLKEGAFRTGQTIDAVLLVGGLYFRDMIFPELGFSLTELDTSIQ